MEKPLLSFGRKIGRQGFIEVSSIEQIPKVIDITKKIYESIGEKRFDELSEIKYGKNQVYGKAQKVLEIEYNKMLKDLLPGNLV